MQLLLLDGYMFVVIVMLYNGCCCGMGIYSLLCNGEVDFQDVL